MAGQHRRLPLSQETVQCSPESSGDCGFIGDLGFSTQPRGLLVPDGRISSITWNGSPFLSMTQQYGSGFSFPAVDQVDTIKNMYNPLPGHSPNHQPTVFPSDETSIANKYQPLFMARCSLPDTFSGPQTQVKVPDDHFAMKLVDSMDDRAPRNLFYTDTPHSPPSLTADRMTNQSRAITDAVDNSSVCKPSMTEEMQIPMMPFSARPFPDNFSCAPSSFKCLTCSTTRLPTTPQEGNQASETQKEVKQLRSSVPAPPSQICVPQDRGMGVEKMAQKLYQCSSCCVIFCQRQGLTRHNKDKHEPKKRCDFCVEFTWPRGRRYVYRRHLQEEHLDTVSQSFSASPIARKQGVKLKGRPVRQITTARRTAS